MADEQTPGIPESLRRRPEAKGAVAALDRLRLLVRIDGSRLMGDHHRMVSRGDEATATRIRSFVERVGENLLELEQAITELLEQQALAELEAEDTVFKRVPKR